MGSLQPPEQSFDPVDLDTLEWIFDSVWTEIQSHYPGRDVVSDAELKAALRRKLFALVCLGDADQEFLRSTLLAGVVPVETSSASRFVS